MYNAFCRGMSWSPHFVDDRHSLPPVPQAPLQWIAPDASDDANMERESWPIPWEKTTQTNTNNTYKSPEICKQKVMIHQYKSGIIRYIQVSSCNFMTYHSSA